MILQAHLEEWLFQPDIIYDLEKGVSSLTGAPDRLKGMPTDAELVFERGGSTENSFFFYTGGSISQVFKKAELDANPDKIREYGYYVVTVYEKIYATKNVTAMHFSSEEAIRKHINLSNMVRWSQKADFDVLADPLCCPDPKKCQIVSRYKKLKNAIAKAEKLADEFNIRFVVAKVIGLVDNH